MNKLNYKRFYFWALAIILLCLVNKESLFAQQPLLLSDAIKSGLQKYQSIEAKRNLVRSSEALVKNTKNEYLPNVVASLQQDYGTVNGQFGPFSGYGAVGVASAGPVYNRQIWNAGFGSAYILNTNWELFTFGRLSSKILLSEAQVKKDSADYAQEGFVYSVKVSGAYLNLLIAQKLVENSNANLNRAIALQKVVLARTQSGLNAGVDSSIANSEVSAARLSLIAATDNELQIRNQLAQLLNADPSVAFLLDSSYFKNIPQEFNTAIDISQNPQVKYYQALIEQSNKTTNYIKKSVLPGVNLFGIFQTRGSGFKYDYNPASNNSYSKSYLDGINPARSNYAAGLSLAWNILSIKKVKEQANAQQYITEAYKNQYDLISTQLKDQLILADQRIANTLLSYKEVPIQYKAAAEAYLQKSVLYKNGLTNIVDLQQSLYALNKAETGLGVANIQVWQALLLKAAASGDFDLFLRQVH
ncbi:MAG: TolC family protein [Bacteroidetes bacterium]|nr:TolC family protein [Bacteroidota bacterium]